MADLVLDVHMEFDPVALAKTRNATREIAEASRRAAEDQCRERGAVLRHTEPREVVTRKAIKAITGTDVLLVSTRWLADGPEA